MADQNKERKQSTTRTGQETPRPHFTQGSDTVAPTEQYFSSTLPSFNQPYWTKQARRTPFPMLAGDMTCDVLVVGAGITGLTTAVLLAQAGRRVALIEMTVVGGGTTGHSTGHLDNYTDQSYETVISKFGADRARLIFEAKHAAINLVETWDKEFSLESMFKRIPAYLYAEAKASTDDVDKELEAARKIGVIAEPAPDIALPFPVSRAIMFPGQGRFNPLKYVYGLAHTFVGLGGMIFENTRAEHMEKKDDRVVVNTNHGVITTHAVALAGHAPLLGTFSLQIRNYPQQSYVLGAKVKDELPDALYWDVMEPYHYTRRASSEDPRLLIIGGADHHTGHKANTHRSFKELERYVRQRYQVEAINYRWSSEYFEPADSMPYIGRVPTYDNIYLGTGFSGDGLTFGTVSGIIMSDLILGKHNEWADVFSPSRIKPIASAGRLSSGVIKMAQHFVGDRVGQGDVESVDKITKGHGGVVVMNGQRLAVYRDEQNALHAMSAACRHMGCIVHWNQAEKTWDCPCHGGRYDAYGRVIAGPPKASLEARSLPAPGQSRK